MRCDTSGHSSRPRLANVCNARRQTFWSYTLATIDVVRSILGQVLQLGPRQDGLTSQSPLLGSLPELDSMAVVSLITALEEQLGVMIDDDEIDASTFATLGSLAAFCEQKLV